ncbi:MAG: aldose 1-epimerase family protein [Rikenellaceae bacterium]
MNLITINNDTLKVDINPIGAEFFSIINLRNGRECLWQGVPEVWKSRSPVLFPIVGALNNCTMRQDGKEYNMAQHGFARASEFEVIKHEADEVLFRLVSNPSTLEKYPYEFVFEIGYKLIDDTIKISYRVSNPSDETIHFQLGAHPGLNYLNYNPEAEAQCYLSFDDKNGSGEILSGEINDKGLLIEKETIFSLTDKLLAVDKDLFNNGALIIENDQAYEICMLDTTTKEPYVSVKFDAPVVGVWSNAKGSYAPYLCIEPWYGRCDKADYTGEFADKDWMQKLDAGATFDASYTITITK